METLFSVLALVLGVARVAIVWLSYEEGNRSLDLHLKIPALFTWVRHRPFGNGFVV